MQEPRLGKAFQYEKDPIAPRTAPIPNRATKPGSQSWLKTRPKLHTSVSESTAIPSLSPATPFQDAQPRLSTEQRSIDQRHSPFSTPPSSDDNVDATGLIPRQLSQSVGGASADRSSKVTPDKKAGDSRKEVQPGLVKSRGSDALPARPEISKPVSRSQRPDLPPRPDAKTQVPSILPAPTLSHSSIQGFGSLPKRGRSRYAGPTSDLDRQLVERSRGNIPSKDRDSGSREIPGGPNFDQRPRTKLPVSPMKPPSDSNNIAQNQYRLHDKPPNGKDAVNEYPDGTSASRRPPYTQHGSQVIPMNYDADIFELCAGYACCAGHLIRVWDLSTGKAIFSLALSEREVKATALAFKAGARASDEGSSLWVGTNYGELYEVEVQAHRVTSLRSNVHNGRQVIKILRYQNSMWTIDEDGTLCLWLPNDNGLPSLESSPVTQKVSRGASFSVVADGLVWLAIGKEIHIIRPPTKETSSIGIERRIALPHGVGEITSAAVVAGQLDKVYFGHNDGKITLCSTSELIWLATVNVSVYKINCLVGTGDRLWAGYNTGKICVYDTATQPWKVVKDWQAHEGPVVKLSVDQSSLWISGSMRVASVSLDNTIRSWDGLLEDDWLETELLANDTAWCNFREMEAVVMTWNAGASTPASLRYEEKESNILKTILPSGKAPDLLIFGFQELVDLEDKRLTAKTLFKGSKRKDANDQEHMSRQYRDWRDHLVRCVEEYMPMSTPYVILHTASMVGLFSCIFIKASQRSSISNVQAAEIKRGMGGLHGNKVRDGSNLWDPRFE
ncbi:MAG: hypothetical protein Q9183_000212 [Haloplaca sp. 2 TL-2023]